MTLNPTQHTARPRGRRRADLPSGRAALLHAAIQAFAELGFERADLRSIARAADVDTALVRVHFGTKADLWWSCMEAVAAEAAPVIATLTTLADDDSRSVYDRLAGVIEGFVAFGVAHPEVRQFVAQHVSESPERADVLIERLARPGYQSVRRLIQAGIECGVVRTTHPALFFSLLSNAIHQPRAVPILLNAIAPELNLADAPKLLAQNIVATFLHQRRISHQGPCPRSTEDIA